MKKISDLLEAGEVFGVVAGFSGSPIFSKLGIEAMDGLLFAKYGDRFLSAKTVLDSDKMLKAYALSRKERFKQWDEVLDSLPLGSSGSVRNYEEIYTEKGERTNDNKELGKVSAYDDDLLIDNDGRESTGKEDNLRDYKRTIKEGKTSVRGMADNLQTYDKTDIIQIIVKDFTNFVALAIY